MPATFLYSPISEKANCRKPLFSILNKQHSSGSVGDESTAIGPTGDHNISWYRIFMREGG